MEKPSSSGRAALEETKGLVEVMHTLTLSLKIRWCRAAVWLIITIPVNQHAKYQGLLI